MQQSSKLEFPKRLGVAMNETFIVYAFNSRMQFPKIRQIPMDDTVKKPPPTTSNVTVL